MQYFKGKLYPAFSVPLNNVICFSAHNEANDHDGHDQADGVKSLLSLYTAITSWIKFSTVA